MKLSSFIAICILLLFCSSGNAQISDNDIVVTKVNKPVRDFPENQIPNTPIGAYLGKTFFNIEGKQALFRPIFVERLWDRLPGPDAPDKEVPENRKEYFLNTAINEVLVYHDSVAVVLCDYQTGEPMQIIGWIEKINGRWLNAGEGLANNIADGHTQFKKYADERLTVIRRMQELENVSTDTLAFINYLKKHGKAPKEFMLDALGKHKIVIYGELHKRKISWDLMKNLIADSRFAKVTGTVFLELPSHAQSRMDSFFSAKTMQPDIVLGILQDEQAYGWEDRGEYEFILELWKINQKLPAKKKIQVVLTDSQAPWHKIKTKADFEYHVANSENRNTHMADVIERTIRTNTDPRNTLFIVGFGHAYKTDIPGFASARRDQPEQMAAGAQLARRFSADEVFTILPHVMRISNSGYIASKARHGLFDYVFKENGNKPVGFALKNSLFGAEPFDMLNEICYNPKTGTYADNYDGYLFLQPLKDEDANYILYDLFTDDFIDELRRRVTALEWDDGWYGIPLEELSKEAIITRLKNAYEGKKRYP